MHNIIPDMLEYVVAPLFPYANSLSISRLLSADPVSGKKGPDKNNAGLELMNILSSANLFYAAGHFADPALCRLFITVFSIELSLLFWLTAQIRAWGSQAGSSAKAPLYMAVVYLMILVLLLLYAS
ncbi:MAG TPA: hypothetical protein VHC48_08730 [Puia sp.]|nr:hypothetical protein [Puia sp.]